LGLQCEQVPNDPRGAIEAAGGDALRSDPQGGESTPVGGECARHGSSISAKTDGGEHLASS
jgi:hypothetical protein